MFLIYLAIFKGKGFLSHASGIEGYFRLREQEIQLSKLGVGDWNCAAGRWGKLPGKF